MGEVHDLVYHGQGGFPYDTVYNMPIQYRKYHILKINEFLEKKAETEKKAADGSKSPSSDKNVHKPNIPQANFSTNVKAPKK